MKKAILIFLLCVALPVSAFNPVVVEPTEPYAVIPVENTDPFQEREFLGDLHEFPDMYELTFDRSLEFYLQLKQRASREPYPFGLLMVKVNDDGSVTEVFRHRAPVDTWTRTTDFILGFSLLEDESVVQKVEPGVYRIEVSTPTNEGEYMLVLGDESTKANYFSMLGSIFKTQQHFDFTWLRFLLSSYVHYPLGILLVIGGIVYTWKSRKQIANNV